jgi:hypothetical protein
VTESTIVPDTKDWTFVINEGCRECGYEPSSLAREGIGARLRATVDPWAAVLARQDVRVRPSAGTWSPLEYGCHVRDVARVFGERVRLMLTVDDAQFDNWDQDQTALEEHYGDQEPATVASDYARAVASAADRFEGLTPEQWQRPGRRSNGSTFTVETIGVYFLHDLEHHLHDVGR